jgi:iron complex outermembrane receptor protein
MPALAQEEASSSTSATSGEIVVTARRREEGIQTVPVAVTAFSQDALEKRAISGPLDLNRAVPGMQASSDAGSPQVNFSVRGRGQFFGAASGSVETYFAEIPLSAPFQTPTLPPQFFDLQSIQVLKGPQGTLFGRNTTGGAVLVVPADPTGQFEGYVRAQVGNYENVQVEGAINLPISDKVKLRVAGFQWHRKGYTSTIPGEIDVFGNVLPKQHVDNQDVTEVRATLLLTPSDFIENSTLFTYHMDKNRSASQAIFFRNPVTDEPIPVTGPAASPRLFETAVNLRRPPSNTFLLANTTTLHLSDNLTLKNIFGYLEAEGYWGGPGDTDGAALEAVDNIRPPRPLKNRQITDEIQLQGKALDDRLEFTVGGIIDLTRTPRGRDANISVLTHFGGGAFNQVFREARFTSKSVFAAATAHLTDTFSISGGVRRIYDNVREASQEFNDIIIRTFADESLPFAVSTAKYRDWAYNAGFEWKPTEGSFVYGGYRRGFKRGGLVLKPPTPSESAFGPETVNDFFFGLKQNLAPLGLRGRFNIEGFYDLYRGAQRPYLTFTGQSLAVVVSNAEKTTYRGFDLDFDVQAARWLDISGNYTFVDSYYNKFTDVSVTDPALLAFLGNPSTDLSGNPPALVSRHKVSATARFHTDLADGGELALLPTFNYQSRFYFNDNSRRQPNSASLLFLNGRNLDSIQFGANYAPGYSTIDLRLEWNKVRGSNFDLAVTSTNLTNKVYEVSGTSIYLFGFESGQFGPPRMVSAEVKYRW